MFCEISLSARALCPHTASQTLDLRQLIHVSLRDGEIPSGFLFPGSSSQKLSYERICAVSINAFLKTEQEVFCLPWFAYVHILECLFIEFVCLGVCEAKTNQGTSKIVCKLLILVT